MPAVHAIGPRFLGAVARDGDAKEAWGRQEAADRARPGEAAETIDDSPQLAAGAGPRRHDWQRDALN
jgi:hypothetical protein